MSGVLTSASALTVRDAEPRDRDAIRDLLTELGYPLDTTTLARRMDRLAAEPSVRAFIAVRDGTVVGFASLL
jgi:N-acetylglutamate synthase-like GNAT family acetyltransferase